MTAAYSGPCYPILPNRLLALLVEIRIKGFGDRVWLFLRVSSLSAFPLLERIGFVNLLKGVCEGEQYVYIECGDGEVDKRRGMVSAALQSIGVVRILFPRLERWS